MINGKFKEIIGAFIFKDKKRQKRILLLENKNKQGDGSLFNNTLSAL